MWNMDAYWIMVTGALVAAVCGLPGSFLVLRRMSMMGDALSHSVLPGIVVAYLLAGSRHPTILLLAAGAMGIVSAIGIELLQKKAKLQSDASMGLVFTFLFAVGVILLTVFAGKVDLDQECVLYGELAYVPLDTVSLFGVLEVPRAIPTLLGLLVVLLAALLLFYQPLKLTTFDPDFARTIGVEPSRWHQGITASVSFTTVASFEHVGAILVLTFLVVVPSTARLLSERLSGMLAFTVGLGALVSILGYAGAAWANVSIAGSMAVSAGILLAVVAWIAKIKRG
jgi:manganese/zinc/iron transport system permease protein